MLNEHFNLISELLYRSACVVKVDANFEITNLIEVSVTIKNRQMSIKVAQK